MLTIPLPSRLSIVAVVLTLAMAGIYQPLNHVRQLERLAAAIDTPPASFRAVGAVMVPAPKHKPPVPAMRLASR